MSSEELRFDITAHDDNAIGTFRRVANAIDAMKDAMARSVQASRDSMPVSDRLVAARNREADASGKVRAAEAALGEIRSKLAARSAEIAAAEERLSTARQASVRSGSALREIAAAEAALNEVRGRADISGSRVAAAEEKVAKARTDAARVSKIVADEERKTFGKRAGQDSGRSFMGGLADWVQQNGYGILKFLGGNGGRSFVQGLSGAMSAPVIGPVITGALVAIAGTTIVAAGAVVGSAFVLGLGSALAGIGIGFAAQAAIVKESWKNAFAGIGAGLDEVSKPFQSTLLALVVTAKRTFTAIKSELAASFQSMAPVVFAFGNDLAKAFDTFSTAFKPLSQGFNAILINLGPALQQAIGAITNSLIGLAKSVAANPMALADMARWIGRIVSDFVGFLTMMNDANASFTRFTGGISAVDVIMGIFRGSLFLLEGAIGGSAFLLGKLADGLNWLAGKLGIGIQVANGTTDALRHAGAGMDSAAKATGGFTAAQDHANHVQVLARAAAINTANAYARQTANTTALLDVTHRLADKLVTLKSTELDVHQAVLDAAASFKKNGRNLNENTQAGVDNWKSLLKIVDAEKQHFDGQVRANASTQAETASLKYAKAEFVHFAEKMGMSSKQAKALAGQLFVTQQQIDAMHGKTIPITYTLDGVNFTLNTKTPSSAGRASGGLIQGPGSGTSDTAGLFALSNNEWVVKASSAQKYGDKAMASVNAGTATVIPGMAAGGGINIHGTGVFKDVAQLRKILGQSMPAFSTPGSGGGAQKWAAVALAALAAAHEPASWLGSLLARMNRESGGNPAAINLTDSNAKAGHPSQGLMQTIPGTFSAYAGPYAGRGILDPFANIYAAIKYTVARYGSGPAGWNRPGGYAKGGWLMPGQMAYNETRKPEAVFNQSQLTAMSQGGIVGMASGGKVLDAHQLHVAHVREQKALDRQAARQEAHYDVLQKLDIYINGAFKQGLSGTANHIGVIFNSLMTKVIGLGLPKGKESRVLAFLRAEDKKLQAMAIARSKVADQLAAAQKKLADVIDQRNQFAAQITSSARSFTSITGAQADQNGNLTTQSVIAQMTEKVRQAQQFTSDLAALRKRGLNLSTYEDIVNAGIEQGDQIAKALLAGNVNTFNEVNRLQANANSASTGLGNTAANALYGGQIRAAQQVVYNINVTGALDSKAIAKQIQQILLDLKRRNGGVSLGIA